MLTVVRERDNSKRVAGEVIKTISVLMILIRCYIKVYDQEVMPVSTQRFESNRIESRALKEKIQSLANEKASNKTKQISTTNNA